MERTRKQIDDFVMEELNGMLRRDKNSLAKLAVEYVTGIQRKFDLYKNATPEEIEQFPDQVIAKMKEKYKG